MQPMPEIMKFLMNILLTGSNNIFQNLKNSCKSGFGSLEQFFLTAGQNNFGNKIPIVIFDENKSSVFYTYDYFTTNSTISQ